MKSIERVAPDWEGMLKNLRRQGDPDRVYYFEHGISKPVMESMETCFGFSPKRLDGPLDQALDRIIAIHEALGLELVRVECPNLRFGLSNVSGGAVQIKSWEDVETAPWPDHGADDLTLMEHFEARKPANMRAFHVLGLWEPARDCFGFENLCYALHDAPDLVNEIFSRVGRYVEQSIRTLCAFESLGAIYIADDLGFKTATFLEPDLLRELVLPWHKRFAEIAHEAGKLFFLHSCGQMYELMDDYIDEVKIDAKHSFEDVILPVTGAKERYGDRLTLLGGMDVDFLARADEAAIRARTREVLDLCMPGGGYFLGSGNWVSSYIPPEHYLWMLDEARRWSCISQVGHTGILTGQQVGVDG